MDEVTILPHLAALGIAYLLAIPIAWDREKEDRSAGSAVTPTTAKTDGAIGFPTS